MRRDRMIEAVNNLKDALHAAEIREVLRLTRNSQQGDDGKKSQKILSAYSIFSQHYLGFDEEEKQLMSLFGLNPLINVNFWSGLLDDDRNMSRKVLSDVDVGVYNVIFVMPKLKELLVRDTDKTSLLVKLDDGVEREVQRMRVFVSEKGNSLTETSVLSNVIKSVDDLYESLSYMHKTQYVTLSIGSIDSGSAKVIDFFGASAIVQDMADVISSVWLRVKHATRENIRYQIEVAMMGAGFIARVNEAQRSSVITEEEGQRITRVVAKSIETLFRNGAFTEDMDKLQDVRASDVLERRTELLEYQDSSKGRILPSASKSGEGKRSPSPLAAMTTVSANTQPPPADPLSSVAPVLDTDDIPETPR